MRLLLLTILLFIGPRAEAQRWVEQFQDGAFTFRSEFAIRKEPLIRDLSQIKQELEQKLKLKIGKAPIEVLLFANQRRYLAAVRKQVPSAANRRALFVKTAEGSRVYAFKSRTLFDADIRHECTHALVHNSVNFIPLWLDEGLAEYFELKAGTRVRPARLNEVRNIIRFGPLSRGRHSLPELESLNDIGQMRTQEYRDSWAWVHYLLNDPTQEYVARRVLVSYLSEIQKGNPPGPFSKYFERYIPHGDTRLVQHFRYFR